MQKSFLILLALLIGAANWQTNANQIISADAAAGVGAGLYESFNSFSGETLVHTKDASGQAALKPISQIQIGDTLLAWDEQADFDAAAAKTTPTNALNSQNTAIQNTATPSPHHYEKVIDVISSHKQQTLIYIRLDNGDTITATQGHPFKTTEGWRDAILLKKGGKLLLKGGDDDKPPRPQAGEGGGEGEQTARYATITEVRTEQKVLPVYNLEVANLHTFYVGQDGVVVHNGSGPKLPPGYTQIGERSHGQPVYKKGSSYISPDADGHNGGVWKKCKGSPSNLRSKATREGTFNADLTKKIGD